MTESLAPTKNETDEENEGTKRATIPTPHSAMFRGDLGRVIHGLGPSTEAHPTAILVQTLALLAGYIGDGPHVEIGGTRHPARIWPLIMGPTARGRKGESKDQSLKIVRSFSSSVSSFVDEHVSSGLSSGEGLVAAFKADADGHPEDPRLVVIETEYARVLSVSKRDGNTLPTILRDLWDRGSARTLTRAAPLRLEGAHLVVIGHITPTELRLKLSAEDVSGGSINRQLLILVERTKLLPDPPAAPPMLELKGKVERAAMKAREASSSRCYSMTRDGRRYWAELYTALDAADTGGAMSEILGRAPAYTQRLALLYALLDGAPQIGAEHLRAGLAVVKYSMDSARIVFGNGAASGDLRRLADEVRKKKRMARTEVSAFFNRNKKKDEIDALVDELVAGKLIEIHLEPHEKGRPTEYLVATNRQFTDHVSAVLGPEDEPLSGFPALRAVE